MADHRTKRQKIEDLLRGAKTDGERRAAQAALDRMGPDPEPRSGYARPQDWSSQHTTSSARTTRTTWTTAEPSPDSPEWASDHIFTSEDLYRVAQEFERLSREMGRTKQTFRNYARTTDDLMAELRRQQDRERITRDFGATFINMGRNMDPETAMRLVHDYQTGKIGIDELRQRMRGDG